MVHTRAFLWLPLVFVTSCQRPVDVDKRLESVSGPSPPNNSASLNPDPKSSAAAAVSANEEIFVANPTDAAPVQGAAAIEPSRLSPGWSATLIIRLKIAPGWHLYAVEGNGGPNQPTRIEATLPTGCSATEEWESPAGSPSVTSTGGAAIYETEAVFKQSLQFESSMLLGQASIVCDVHYQACDRHRCLRPERLTLNVPIQLVSEEN